MKTLTLLLGLLLAGVVQAQEPVVAAAPEVEPPRPPPPSGPRLPRNAAFVELRLGAAATLSGAGGGATAVPSLLVGGRLAGRVQLGLGIAFVRTLVDMATGPDPSNTLVTFAPTLAVDAFQSRDLRFALYVKAALPIGIDIACAGSDCATLLSVGYDLGLGARYLLHRHFALGLEAGSTGTFIGVDQGKKDQVFTWYGALVGSAYF